MGATMSDDRSPDALDQADHVDDTSAQMYALLTGHDAGWQSAVIADLTAKWVAGHHPSLRVQMYEGHLALIRALIPIAELQQFGPAGHPGWADLPPGMRDGAAMPERAQGAS